MADRASVSLGLGGGRALAQWSGALYQRYRPRVLPTAGSNMLTDPDDLPPLVLDRPRAQKLQNSIKTLNPTNKLAINDWLIALRAACGYPFVDC